MFQFKLLEAYVKNKRPGTEEMEQQLGACITLEENLGPVPSTHTALTASAAKDPISSSGHHGLMLICGTRKLTQAHTYKHK